MVAEDAISSIRNYAMLRKSVHAVLLLDPMKSFLENMMLTKKKISMHENDKTVVEISDEGVIFVDYLAADYEFLFNLIINKSCHLDIASMRAYLNLTMGMQDWMKENKTIEEYNEVSNFISNEYKASVEQINL